MRRLLGVLKLVKGQTDPATGATMVRKTVVAEAALRQEIVSLLQHRDCLADPEQAVALLGTLRLEETLEWASERWDELGPLVAANAPSEHATLLAALALLNIAPDVAPRRPETTERGS